MTLTCQESPVGNDNATPCGYSELGRSRVYVATINMYFNSVSVKLLASAYPSSSAPNCEGEVQDDVVLNLEYCRTKRCLSPPPIIVIASHL